MAERVVVAMSGGVDSSVAAALMVEAGHETIGVGLRSPTGPHRSPSTGAAARRATWPTPAPWRPGSTSPST